MKQRSIILFTIIVLFTAVANAQNYSDIINIQTLVSAMANNRNAGAILTSKGYKRTAYCPMEEGSHYGYTTYYKNCKVRRDGTPVSYSKGNSSTVQIGSMGVGPFINLTVYSSGAYNYIYKKLVSAGYRLYRGGNYYDYSLRKGHIAIDVSRSNRGGSFIIESTY